MKDEGILMENKDTELILKAIAQINNNIEQLDGKIDNLREDMDKKIDDLRENMEAEFFAVHREIDNVYQLAKRNREDIEKLSQIQGSARMDKMEARITLLEEKYRELKQA